MGNRTHISSHYYNQVGTDTLDSLWYTYDAMNRVKISQGTGAMGSAVAINATQGIELTYSLRGDRLSARQYATTLQNSYGTVTGAGSRVRGC